MRATLALKFDTFGDPSTSPTGGDQRYRFCTRVPAWDAEDLYRSALRTYPDELAWSFNPQTGEATVGGLTFGLARIALLERFLLRARVDRLGVLGLGINASATTINILNTAGSPVTGLTGRTILIGREAIYLASYSAPDYTCVRGVLGTTAVAHGAGLTDDAEVFDAAHGPTLRDLGVELIRVPWDTGGYTQEEVLYRGVLQPAEWDGAGTQGQIALSIDTALSLLRRRQLGGNVLRLRRQSAQVYGGVDTPSAAAGQAWFYRATQRNRDWATSPLVGGQGETLISLGGECVVRVGAWRLGSSADNFVAETDTLLQPIPFAGSAEVPTDPPEEAWECFCTHSGSPSNDASPSVSTLPLSNNALTLTLQILTSSATGDNYDSGGGATSYDLGLADHRGRPILGCAVPWSFVDVEGIEALRERLGPTIFLNALFVGVDGKPFEAYTFLRDKVLRPFGLALAITRLGRITVLRADDALSGTTAPTLTASDLDAIPRMRQAATETYEAVEVAFNDRPGVGPEVDTFTDAYVSTRQLADGSSSAQIDAGGVSERSVVEALALAHLTRWRDPIPEYEVSTLRTLDLWPGDLVRVTHAVIPGITGSRGVTAAVMLVVSRELALREGRCRYLLWWVGALYNRTGLWAPSARVVSYSAPDVTVEANAFTSTANPDLASDAAAWAAHLAEASGGNLNVRILDADLAPRGTAKIVAVDTGAHTLELDSPSVTPAAGDVIVLAAYDDATGESTQRFAFMAGSDDTLGTGNADPYEWVS